MLGETRSLVKIDSLYVNQGSVIVPDFQYSTCLKTKDNPEVLSSKIHINNLLDIFTQAQRRVVTPVLLIRCDNICFFLFSVITHFFST